MKNEFAVAYSSFIANKCWHCVAAVAYLLSGGMRWGQTRPDPWLVSWFGWGQRVAVWCYEYKCIITGMLLKSMTIYDWEILQKKGFSVLQYNTYTTVYYKSCLLYFVTHGYVCVWQIQDMAIRCIQKNIKKNRGVKGWPWWKLMTTVRPLIQVQLTEEQIRGKDVSTQTHTRAQTDTHMDELNLIFGSTHKNWTSYKSLNVAFILVNSMEK